MKKFLKNIKSFSILLLNLYFILLFTAAFHHHKIDFYTSETITKSVNIADSNTAMFCLFNQLNNPNFYYSPSNLVTIDNQLTDLNFKIAKQESNFFISSESLTLQLRAPPIPA